MEHPHLGVVRAWFDAFERSDLEAAGELLARDGVLHVRQPIELAGDYVGLDAFLEFYRAKRARAATDSHIGSRSSWPVTPQLPRS